MNYHATPLSLRVQGLSIARGDCWSWAGSLKQTVPMIFSHGGMVSVRKALALEQGPLPKDARHKPTCADPMCVNPSHTLRLPARPFARIPVNPLDKLVNQK